MLQKLAALPIQSWSYRSQASSVRHLGPMAQDFYAAFGLGESDTTITTTDIDGVNMLAIQALEKRTRALQQEIEMLRAGMQALLRVAADALVDRPDSDVDPQLARSVIELVLDHLDAPEKQPDPSTTPSPTTPTERRLP